MYGFPPPPKIAYVDVQASLFSTRFLLFAFIHFHTGSEYGIVVLSMVRSQPIDSITTSGGRRREADIGWRRSNLGFITDRHQICVGITRCKYGLIIVGELSLITDTSMA